MKRWCAGLFVVGLSMAGCTALGPLEAPFAPKPPPRPAQVKPKPSQFDCSFSDGDKSESRSYLMAAGTLTEKGKPHTRFKITVDDGRTIAARHEARGGAMALLTIDLMQHDAVLTEISSVTGDERALSGTCAESR